MSDAIVPIAPKDFGECTALSKILANSGIIPLALRKKPEDVLAIILAGNELGLTPMAALRGINLIQGKVSMSAELMGALVRNSSKCEVLRVVESSAKVATWETKRKDGGPAKQYSFTIEQAQRAGLQGDNWRKYPEAMLRARALSVLCKAEYQDVLFGCYEADSEELLKDVTPTPDSGQSAHIEARKEQLRKEVEAGEKAVSEIVEGQVVTSADGFRVTHLNRAEPVNVGTQIASRITQAKTLADLNALGPEIMACTQADKDFLKPIFIARKEALK